MNKLYEPTKKFFLNFMFAVFICLIPLSLVTLNSNFLKPAVKGPFVAELYELILILAFLFLAITTKIYSNTLKRENKFLELMNKRDDPKTFYEEKCYNKEVSKIQKKRKNAKTMSIVFAVLSVICLLFVFASGELAYVIIELGKPEIDRAVGESSFRLYMDLSAWLSFVLIVISFLITTPIIIRNRKLPLWLSVIIMVLGIYSVVHYIYFCMGNFTNYPSLTDFAVSAISLFIVMLQFFAIKTESKKKTLDEWKNAEYVVY